MKKVSIPFCALLISWTLVAAPSPYAQEAVEDDLTRLSESFVRLAEQVRPAVVQVFTTRYARPEDGILPSAVQLVKERAAGSGVIVDEKGYILTNAHVVDRARRVTVLPATAVSGLPGRQSILAPMGPRIEARVIGVDEETDLAVLKIDIEGLTALPMGDSDLLRPGQIVVSFGSPLGLSNSVTMGVVSATARQLEPDAPMIYIQTDAAINPGNSGGPLVNAHGELIGINTLILSQSGGNEGIGFAAPSNIANTVFKQIKEHGRVRRGHVGLRVQTITPTLARALGLPQSWGVIVSDVTPGGFGQSGGIQPGDVILSLDGKIMENGRQFEVNVYQRSFGDLVQLDVLRGGARLTKSLTVIEREDEDGRFIRLADPQENLVPELGIMAIEIDRQVRLMLPPLRLRGGLVVAARGLFTPVQGVGFLPGDIIFAVNDKSVDSIEALRRILKTLQSGDAVAVQIQRGFELSYVSFEME